VTYASKRVGSDGPGVEPGVECLHLVDLKRSAAACKAVYAGSIPTSASITVYLRSHQWAVAQTRVGVAKRTRPRGARIACNHSALVVIPGKAEQQPHRISP
jgi:hypothetical protein